MGGISTLDIKMDAMKIKVEDKLNFLGINSFDASELTPANTSKRKARAKKDFWYFDKTYFPSQMYRDGYYKPSQLHKDIHKSMCEYGVTLLAAPRGFGKTVTAKKTFVWNILHGKHVLSGVTSETLDKANKILDSIRELITQNERIMHDYKIKVIKSSEDDFQFIIQGENYGKITIASFSEGRSVRGYSAAFNRPTQMYGEDFENLLSSMDADAVQQRIDKIVETYNSMVPSKSTYFITANDIDNRCAFHVLREKQEKGTLLPPYRVKVYKGWTDEGKSLWYSKYPAKTEEQFKTMVEAIDEADYQTSFQQNPTPQDGLIFARKHYQTYDKLPNDAKGVLYCDPNLAKKGKGDSTAITSLLYSPSQDMFYIDRIACRSFSDSNDLLDLVLEIKHDRHFAVGFDGNVGQESSWSQHVKNYSYRKKRAYLSIKYCRYNIDNLTKNAQAIWSEGRVAFHQDIIESDEGRKFLSQCFAFRGKKFGKKDDAPDSMVGAFELITSRHLGRRAEGASFTIRTIDERLL